MLPIVRKLYVLNRRCIGIRFIAFEIFVSETFNLEWGRVQINPFVVVATEMECFYDFYLVPVIVFYLDVLYHKMVVSYALHIITLAV